MSAAAQTASPSRRKPALTTSRAPAEVEALAAAVLGKVPTSVERIPAGLGLRHFYRLHFAAAPHRVIARVDAPEDPAGRPAGVPPEPPLEPLRTHLEGHGLPVPRRFGGDAQAGIELLEDAGDLTLERAARLAPERCAGWLRRIVDTIPRLQQVPRDPAVAAFERHLDAPLFRYKAELFAAWSLPQALGRSARASEIGAVREAFAWIAGVCAEAPERLAHRDLQSRNLLLADLEPETRIVWIDLQGAFLAPPEYDLVCLLRDSYRPTPDAELDALLARVGPALPDAPPADVLRRRFDLLTLTRKGKDHARFLYAAATRGREEEPAALAATARMLHAAASATAGLAPELERLAELVRALPEQAR